MTAVEIVRVVALVGHRHRARDGVERVLGAGRAPRHVLASAAGVARGIAGSVRTVAPRLPTYEVRDRVLSYVGPASLVSLFALWLSLVLLGFSLIIWWDAGIDFASALGIAGSSVFTLGIATAPDAGPGRSRS